MPTIRKVYKSGSVSVVNLPPAYREIADLPEGCSAQIEVWTARKLLESMGVAPSIVQQIELSEEHFITIRRHHE